MRRQVSVLHDRRMSQHSRPKQNTEQRGSKARRRYSKKTGTEKPLWLSGGWKERVREHETRKKWRNGPQPANFNSRERFAVLQATEMCRYGQLTT